MSARTTKPLISLIVPCFNEEPAIEMFFATIVPVLEAVPSIRFEIVCINDGSTDATLDKLVSAAARDARVRVIDLTRNFGKEAALTAGLDEALGDAVIPIDADLQDPPILIPTMVRHWLDGAEVVAAKRASRACDTFAKRVTARLYYRVHNALSEVKLPENVGDFRLMDRAVVNALRSLPERRRFMKGLFAWVGFKTVIVEYEREARSAGRSKFSGWRLWNFALEGITSFSTVPLRSWTYIGLAIAVLAFGYGSFIIGRTLLFGNPVPGYASLLSVLLFLGGIELVGVGIVGEYVGRIYHETKERPVYLVRRRYQARKKITTLPLTRVGGRAELGQRADHARRTVAPRLRAAGR
ncbi:glycosyltransferase family 2 protein [Trinickia caryophylli]|uniref:Glycosyltransferase involved in cell wall bisynthesis n=1 Tax=Trinickia caryophylli TaxID=28094 RepID=A0A1X7CWZ9_TRICW|nr:glycosyltransferase family 2 protein [Trinickia caryophylli]PMS13447.1 glycosyltransferase [Trinickia caryophylli]TRX13696.1 glycosyltransferase family 2 protein [Trinickia caryophylli]WQE15280.1 glycosyltransferase family 2 protein [Trinickia caryophylli]SMF04586.1 Glycosyltransferase involved in cell wall bisynthesis [Trinickia caryophylli]GLU30968.1 glycosyl transferase [Trinickia caryophylli]